MTPNARGALTALVAMGTYATHDAIIKALGASYPAMQILFFASLLSFPLVSVMLVRERGGTNLRPNNPALVLLRSVCIVVSGAAGFYAFSVLPLAQVYAILFATPLLVTLLSMPILGERVGRHRLGAVVTGLLGVLIVLRPGQTALTAGHFAAMAGASATALASVLVRKLGTSERAVVLMLYPMLGNFVLTGGLMSLAYKPMALADLAACAAIAALGLLASFLVISSYRQAEAAMVAPMQYSQIVWATIYGWMFFGEGLDRPTVIGAGLVIASGLYIVWREGRGGHSRNQPVLAARMRPELVTAPRSALLARLLRGR